MTNLIHKKGIKQTAEKVLKATKEKLILWDKAHIKIGITKVKYLMRRHLRLSRKKKRPVLKTKTE